jgi:hypothetical protein
LTASVDSTVRRTLLLPGNVTPPPRGLEGAVALAQDLD